MKQVVQNYKSGELSVIDAPAPACKPGGVLVASRYSLISIGTEMMKVSEARQSLLGKARSRPDQVRKVIDSVAQVGPAAAYQKVINKLDSYTPLGYSLCGVVTEVGAGAGEFAVGDLVACAGNEHALHAELNWVPVNLCVPVPAGVDPRLAAFATVGAIALHGVRRAEVTLGEAACVIGLGLVGQLVAQLLMAAGARVVGIDPVEARCALAEGAGVLAAAPPTPDGLDRVERSLAGVTGGLGADYVFLAAGGPSNDPVLAAARLARDRARIVDIGKCRLDLPWNEYYDKELEVRFSRSYGPGRYDDHYELDGIDYPAGYVRWTERRNLACFLDLVARGQIDLEPLVSGAFPLEDAVQVYDDLNSGALKGVAFLFSYPSQPAPERAAAPGPGLGVEHRPGEQSGPAGHVASNSGRTGSDGLASGRGRAGSQPGRRVGTAVRVGFLGAGNYASSMLLPKLQSDEGVELAHVVTTTSLSAANARRRFGFARASTDAGALLEDESIDAVFVVTRHQSHAELTARALEHGKAVFVEKPLALTGAEVSRVLEVVDATGNDRLMVGFNRRFAPMLVELRSRFGAPAEPGVARYLVNAGRLDAKSWYAKAETEGSRFDGEGGHFIDTVSWWLGALPVEVHAAGTPDGANLLVTLGWDDGSAATIAYATGGNPRFPKETFEASAGGRSARLDNFRRATVWRGRRHQTRRSLGRVDKGQGQELEAFLAAVRSGGPMPIPMASLVATTRATHAVAQSLATGRPVKV